MKKVALCVISKKEDIYLKDFIEYYKAIGFANIIFGDNNDFGDNLQKKAIQVYIDNGFIKYENIQNKPLWQCKFYEDMYNKYKAEFDYIAFYDVDEYLYFTDSSIKTVSDFLERPEFERADFIRLNWQFMTDNNQLYYENKPVMERFVEYKKEGFENTTIKSIAKCKKETGLRWVGNPHVCRYTSMGSVAVDGNGELLNNDSPFIEPPRYDKVYIKHFWSLSTEEYVKRRYKRSSATSNAFYGKKEWIKKEYFGTNEYTEEKERVFEEFCNQIDKEIKK